jgi:hypothetical protein
MLKVGCVGRIALNLHLSNQHAQYNCKDDQQNEHSTPKWATQATGLQYYAASDPAVFDSDELWVSLMRIIYMV